MTDHKKRALKNPNEGVTIEDAGWKDEFKLGKFDHAYHSLTLRKRRSRSVIVGVWFVSNPENEHFGKFWFSSWMNSSQNYYADTPRKAKHVADYILRRFRREIESGKRNWWTLKLKKASRVD